MHRLSLLLLSLCAAGSLAACSIKTSEREWHGRGLEGGGKSPDQSFFPEKGFGCFRDNSTSRVLPYVALERVATWEDCAAQCQQMGLTGTAGVGRWVEFFWRAKY